MPHPLPDSQGKPGKSGIKTRDRPQPMHSFITRTPTFFPEDSHGWRRLWGIGRPTGGRDVPK
jgi:hypothetical protein